MENTNIDQACETTTENRKKVDFFLQKKTEEKNHFLRRE